MHKPADQHWGGGTGLAIGTPGRDNSWVDPFRSVGILVRIDGPNQSAKINRWPPKKILNKREPRARTFARTYRVMSLPWYSRGGLHIMEPSHMASSLSWCTYSHTAPCSNCSVASRPGVGGTVLTSAASSQPHDDHNVRSCLRVTLSRPTSSSSASTACFGWASCAARAHTRTTTRASGSPANRTL